MKVLQIFWVGEMLYVLAISLVKVSILMFYASHQKSSSGVMHRISANMFDVVPSLRYQEVSHDQLGGTSVSGAFCALRNPFDNLSGMSDTLQHIQNSTNTLSTVQSH